MAQELQKIFDERLHVRRIMTIASASATKRRRGKFAAFVHGSQPSAVRPRTSARFVPQKCPPPLKTFSQFCASYNFAPRRVARNRFKTFSLRSGKCVFQPLLTQSLRIRHSRPSTAAKLQSRTCLGGGSADPRHLVDTLSAGMIGATFTPTEMPAAALRGSPPTLPPVATCVVRDLACPVW